MDGTSLNSSAPKFDIQKITFAIDFSSQFGNSARFQVFGLYEGIKSMENVHVLQIVMHWLLTCHCDKYFNSSVIQPHNYCMYHKYLCISIAITIKFQLAIGRVRVWMISICCYNHSQVCTNRVNWFRVRVSVYLPLFPLSLSSILLSCTRAHYRVWHTIPSLPIIKCLFILISHIVSNILLVKNNNAAYRILEYFLLAIEKNEVQLHRICLRLVDLDKSRNLK